MAKFNVTQGKTVVQPPRKGLLKDISDQLDLVDSETEMPTAIPTDIPTTAPQVLPTPTEEQAAELTARDKANEAAQSIQDTYKTAPSDLGDMDVENIFGPLRAPMVIEGLKQLDMMDTVMLPFNEESNKDKGTMGKKEAISMLGFPRPAKVLEEGVKDVGNYVDKAKTIPLTQAEMFYKLGAMERTDDSRNFKVTSDFNTFALATAEVFFAKDADAQKSVTLDLVEAMGSKEAAEMSGVMEEELPSGVNVGALGSAIYDNWTMTQQRAEEGPNAELNRHLDDTKRMSKEAEELLGSYAKVIYGRANPGVVSRQPVVLANGLESVDYLLTPLGIQHLTERNQHLMEPQVFVRPQLTATPKSTTQHSKSRQSTGKHVEEKVKGKRDIEEEARSNMAEVRHVVPAQRKKLAFVFFGVAVEQSGRAKLDEDGKVVVASAVGDAYSMGQKLADKINSMSANTILEIQGLREQITEIQQTGFGWDRIPDLEKRIAAMSSFAAKTATPEWKMSEYRRQSTKALQVMQEVAEFSGDSFAFTNYVQKGTSRIGLSAKKMNPQNHKIVRQLVGEGTIYNIQPNSNSTAERAMLVTMGAHLFPEPNLTPEKILKDMRSRIQMKDDKVMRIAEVGRKIKGIMDNYNSDNAVAATLNLNMDRETGQVSGIQAFVGEVKPQIDALVGDAEVVRFIQAAFKHPNEAINIIEEAVELGQYLDSVESGKPFQSTMRPIEVDGISNGVAVLGMQIGSRAMAHRTGVISTDPDRILADFTDALGNKFTEATIRDSLATNMGNSLMDLVGSPEFNGAYSVDADYESVKRFLDLAIQNVSEFLKPPIMTMPYGQAVESMKPQMLRAITTSPELLAMVQGSSWSEVEVSDMLHKILAHNLEITLGPDVVAFSQAMKDLTQASMAADEPIVYQKATGTVTSINSADYVPTGGPTVEAKLGTLSTAKDGSPRRNEGKDRLKVHPRELKMGSLGVKAGGGSAVKLGILPQGVIGQDGAAITNTFAGNSWKQLQGETGTKSPYVISIYDAIMTSLGSFEAASAALNRTWKKTTIEYDVLGELHAGAVDALAKGRAKLHSAADLNPDGLADARHAQYFIDVISKDKGLNADAEIAFWKILKDADSRLKDVESTYGKSEAFRLTSTADLITNRQLFTLFMINKPNADNALYLSKRVANNLKMKREALGRELGSNPSNQYYPDVLKSFDF